METGTINVLISRRNKSLTVEQVEEEITDRIAAMEIEDEVNILISNAIDNLELDDEITEVIDPKLLLLETKLTVASDDLTGRITTIEGDIADISEILSLRFASFQNDIDVLNVGIGDNQLQITNYELRI